MTTARRATANKPRRVSFDARTWSGALALICAFAAVLWAVEIVNVVDGYRLDRFGLRPRAVSGLWGIVTQPFLHAGYTHLAANTVPVIGIGWVLMLAGARVFAAVTVVVIVLGGLLTWLVAPSDTVIVGASGLVFGWLGYLLARAVFSRRLKWIAVAVAVLFFFGALLNGLVPRFGSNVSWQAHVCGFVAGAAFGALLHPRQVKSRRRPRPVAS